MLQKNIPTIKNSLKVVGLTALTAGLNLLPGAFAKAQAQENLPKTPAVTCNMEKTPTNDLSEMSPERVTSILNQIDTFLKSKGYEVINHGDAISVLGEEAVRIAFVCLDRHNLLQVGDSRSLFSIGDSKIAFTFAPSDINIDKMRSYQKKAEERAEGITTEKEKSNQPSPTQNPR